MNRTFIAIDIPGSLKINECLDSMSSKLAGEKIRWVTGNNLHLTLKFLGDTEEKTIVDVGTRLKKLTQNLFTCRDFQKSERSQNYLAWNRSLQGVSATES